MRFRELLVAEWARFGSLSDPQLEQLEFHYKLMIQWNKVLNLTRIEGLEDVVRFHYCESLFLGSVLPAEPRKIADVGSGAGFPGVPVAVLRPDCTVTLIESHQRKAVFLTEVSSSLSNASVAGIRAESATGAFDLVISRAVVPQTILSLGLSSAAAILMSEADLSGLPTPSSVFPIPWGSRRIVALFHVEHRDAKI